MSQQSPEVAPGPDPKASRKRALILLAVLVVLALIASLVAFAASNDKDNSNNDQAAVGTAPNGSPNIVFVLTDDLDTKALAYMPKVKELLTDQGTTFDNYLYNISQCCPSRSTMLRGQYSQNTGVDSNSGKTGGFATFLRLGDEESTMGTWIKGAGYSTAYLGKYMNGYMQGGEPMDEDPSAQEPGTGGDASEASRKHVPPGWDDWFGFDGGGYSAYNYEVNHNGELTKYGSKPEDYATDVMAAEAQTFLKSDAAQSKPFFITVAPFAPHTPSTPAPRYADLFPDVKYPRTPSFNEADVSDKVDEVKDLPLLDDAKQKKIDEQFRKRIQSLQAVDEMVDGLVKTLDAQGKLDNTIIAFGSDNGYHLGEHRMPNGKLTIYDEDIRVPFIIRGPGIAKGATRQEIVGNVDVAETLADIAGATAPDFVDGRSWMPLLTGKSPDWRNAYPIRRAAKYEHFIGVRTADYAYAAYDSGTKALYDLKADPYELDNVYATAPQALKDKLQAITETLAKCKADECRKAEDNFTL